MRQNKLVRDKIPEILKQHGKIPVTHIASNKEYYAKLKEKLGEESDEFLKNDNIEELADIMEVIRAICGIHNVTVKKIEHIRKQKAKKRGTFKKRIILERIK